MKIPLLDLKAQYLSIKNEVNGAIKRVLEKQEFILGEEVEKLEKEIASYCSRKYAVGVASGTDALTLSLKALGIREGDEVITAPFTFIATGEAISNVGARPVFVDIDPHTYNIDPALIESEINDKTRAILAVHIYGQCADMDPIMDIAKRHNLKVVEDCAQAIGARYKNRKSGSMGDAGCMSFFPSKNLGGIGDGGMVVTNDKNLADKLRILRVHGSNKRYYHDILGYNSRLDNLQAAVLRIKLKYLDKWIASRQRNAARYNSLLSGIKAVKTPFISDYTIHTYHQYVIKSKERDSLIDFLSKNDIESRVYYPVPLHLQKCYRFLGYPKGSFPNTEEAADNTLALPVYPELKEEDQVKVTSLIKESLEKSEFKKIVL